MYKKWLIAAVLLSMVAQTYAAYPEVECSSDSAFTDYSCGQCFDWGEVKNGDNISFLDDLWVNETTNDKVMYKSEQKMPKMYDLNGATFSTNPDDEKLFWEYTSELQALKPYDTSSGTTLSGSVSTGTTSQDSFVLPAGKNITWIKSTLGSAYRFDSVPEKGKNAGLLAYDLKSHDVVAGTLARNETAHRECVLFKSAQAKAETPEPTPVPEKITQVKTGPELYFAIVLLSLLAGLALVMKKNAYAVKNK